MFCSRRPRYSDAYGDYMGGYGPGGGFGPRPLMHGPSLMGPMRPPRPHGPPRGPRWGSWDGRQSGPERSMRRKFEDDRTIKYLMSEF